MDTWLGLAPTFAVAAVLLVLPGTLVLARTGLGPRAAVLAAPPVSLAIVLAAGAMVSATGRAFTLGTGLGAVAGVTAVAGLLARLGRRRRGPARPDVGTDDRRPVATPGSRTGPLALPVAVLSVTTAIAWTTLAEAVQTPATIPQMPDVVFHLGAVEWMVEHGSASLLDVIRYAQFPSLLDYPGGMHPVIAAVAAWTGQAPVVAAHGVLVAVIGIVWPAGMMLLARVVLGPAGGADIAAGLLAVVFTSYPFRLLAWGPLWPNLVSAALLPAVIAVALCAVAPTALLSRGRPPLSRPASAVLAGIGLLVLAVTQPNALATGLVFAVAVAWWAVPLWRGQLDSRLGATRASRWGAAAVRVLVSRVALVAAVVGLVLLLGRISPRAMFLTNAHVKVTLEQALADAITFVDGPEPGAWLLLVLVLVGALVLAVRRATRWPVAALVASVVLFVLLYALNSPQVRSVTWLWWNDQVRLRAVTVLPALLCAAAAIRWIGTGLARWTPGRGGAPTTPMTPSAGTILVALVVLVALRGGIPGHREQIEATYAQSSPEWSWATLEEQDALRTLATHVPPGSVVAANPWRGGMFLYILAGTEVLYPTQYSLDLPDRRLLGGGLDRVADAPAVCAAAQRQRVDYVITGGDVHWWGYWESAAYAGIDAVVMNGAFPVVAAAGPYVLRRLPACRPAQPGP